MARSSAGKRVIKDKVDRKGPGTFVVGKVASSEEPVRLEFGRDVKYDVVKLSVENLPRTCPEGNPLRWINNFAFKGPTHRYPQRVKYAVFLKERAKGKWLVTYDERGVKPIPPKDIKHHGARGSKPAEIEITLYRSDPAIGEG